MQVSYAKRNSIVCQSRQFTKVTRVSVFGKSCLERGQWAVCSTKRDGVQLQACRLYKLQPNDFIFSCNNALQSSPRVSKHHDPVTRSQVAKQHLKYDAVIDAYNHNRSGSCALEDVQHTKNTRRRQLAGRSRFASQMDF